jgi:hypothetical protein
MSPRRSGRYLRRDRDFRIAFGVRGRSGILGVLCRGRFVDNTAGAGGDVAASWQCRRSRHGDEGSFTAKLCRVIRRPRTYYAGGKRLFLVVGGCGAGLATMQAVYLLSYELLAIFYLRKAKEQMKEGRGFLITSAHNSYLN